ncbi:hypothetical protein M404DRAFT_620468 [Pisolithus tinctorius Marx 270]|uniref:Uncharacterized protein n=1 Tax=Pisolithus tinctorius Marx 270 TaxID=870435 RepID=A0A0C3J307_PISTI|nr:hypothetical protein M404DRAFT_620468 [Pisolithus tinctorius Marx 270]
MTFLCCTCAERLRTKVRHPMPQKCHRCRSTRLSNSFFFSVLVCSARRADLQLSNFPQPVPLVPTSQLEAIKTTPISHQGMASDILYLLAEGCLPATVGQLQRTIGHRSTAICLFVWMMRLSGHPSTTIPYLWRTIGHLSTG